MIDYLNKTILSFLFLAISLVTHGQNENFKQLNTTNGLSINTIKHITQDYLGFIWIGTQDGLCKYDATKIQIYKNEKDHLFTFGDNDISYIFEDSNLNLWVCTTHGGVAKYDRKNDIFINYNKINGTKIKNLHINCVAEISGKKLVFGTQSGLSYFDLNKEQYYINERKANLENENIKTIYRASNNTIWIGSLAKGIENFDFNKGTLHKYSTSSLPPFQLQGNSVNSIIEDNHHNIWVGTWGNGLSKISPNGIQTYRHDEHNTSTISHDAVFALAISSKGELWVATEDEGLNKFNPIDETFHHIKRRQGDIRSLADNSLQCIFFDSHENMWVGTYSHGVSILPRFPSPFKHIKNNEGHENSLSSNNISSVLKDSKNRLWIGTDGGGLNLYDEKTNRYTIFKHNEDKINSIGANAILDVYEDKEGVIWVGTYRGGLARFNEEEQNFTSFKHDINDKESISNNIVSHIFEDKEGDFWVGTWRNGFNKFHKETGKFTQYPFDKNNKNGIPSSQVNYMVEGTKNDLWLATENGLVNFDKKEGKFHQYKKGLDSRITISDDAVSTLFLDEFGILWIGTRGGSLNKFNTETKQFSNFKDAGFSSDIIYQIIPETSTKLWISTNAGISEFNTITSNVRNYGSSEGILGTQFVTGSGCIDKNGLIYFGSTEGLNFFNPDKILVNKQSSKLNFTDFKIFNKGIIYENSKVIDQHISLAEKITLDYKQSVFTVSFSYLNFIHPEKTNYEYQLVGFDEDWVSVGSKNFATYTNLDPAEYLFKVRANNEADNTEFEERTLNIEIVPPIYMTTWFKILVFVLIVLIIYFIFYQRIKVINNNRLFLQKSNRVLEREVDQRKKTEQLYKKEKEKAEKALVVKDDFLSNMSHEIRTPLNMILGYLQLLESDKNNIDEFLKVMKVSADNLLHLVNQILDLSKIEKGKLQLNHSPFNLLEYINELKQLFNDSITSKGLDFIIDVDKTLPEIIIGDKQRVNQVLTNLLGNAIKFTENGLIKFNIQLINQTGNHVDIQFNVEDSGIGIASSKMKAVFEKFTQEESDITRKFGGSGLGLTIAKELTSLLSGTIKVESTKGKGSVFSLTLPFKIEKTNPNLVLLTKDDDQKSIVGLTILIVDDNEFNLTLTSTIIEANQAIAKTAISGKKALEVLDKEVFNIILMDIHMPEMNGYEVTEEIIKRNIDTPIIGCTADIFDETHKKCIDSGMRDVITKPFQIKDLLDKINYYT
jgi:signal transduction histidine kinase/ligand-binding sensor domain-containing protein/CheY-like chemotaxis protein